MAITKFKITRAPKRATLNILGVAFVLNQEYSITNQQNMNVVINDLSVPYDDFGFKLGNDKGTWSPEYKCTINGNVEAGAFTITNDNYNVKLNEDTVIPFVLENQSDRIKLLSHNPKYGQFLINGNEAVIGKTYMRYELTNIVFASNYDVNSQNVSSVILYVKGNKNGESPTCTMTFKSTANLAASIQSSTAITGIL